MGIRDRAARDLRNSRIGAKNIFIPSNADSLSTCGLQCRGGLARDWGVFAKTCEGCRLWPSACVICVAVGSQAVDSLCTWDIDGGVGNV